MYRKALPVLTGLLGVVALACCAIAAVAYQRRLPVMLESSLPPTDSDAVVEDWTDAPNAIDSVLLRLIEATGGTSDAALTEDSASTFIATHYWEEPATSDDHLGKTIVTAGEIENLKEVQSADGKVYAALIQVDSKKTAESRYIYVFCATQPHLKNSSRWCSVFGYLSNRKMRREGREEVPVIIARAILNEDERPHFLAPLTN